jgi:hypothetical protein
MSGIPLAKILIEMVQVLGVMFVGKMIILKMLAFAYMLGQMHPTGYLMSVFQRFRASDKMLSNQRKS